LTNLPVALTDQIARLLKENPKSDLIQLLADSFTESGSERNLPQEVKVPTLTKAHTEALARLPEVFGKVRVTEPRRLTDEELTALVEERETIDTLMAVLKKRKEETLRENLANHLDRVAESEGLVNPESAETNDAGHYLVKQDFPVDGTDKKVQAIVSEGRPLVDSARLEELHQQGHISRADYLAITSVPPVARVFDADKARKAILKNPALLNAIAPATRKPKKTLTIKVAKA